ncbi:MAG: hypothetical protein HRF47_10215 [Chloroflexota bacterium]|jgi:hypothetical protein
MTNILFHYIHRDEGNSKDFLTVVLENPDNLPLDAIEARIKRLLVDGVFFVPNSIGLPRSDYADPSDWHEFDHIEESDSFLSTIQFPLMTVGQLIDRLQNEQRSVKNQRRSEKTVVSLLQFLKNLRGVLGDVVKSGGNGKIVMVFNKEDWSLLLETLELDAKSEIFESNLRESILLALGRSKLIDIAPLKKIWRKIPYLQADVMKMR